MTIRTTISEDGQITIPTSVLEMLHLKPGSEVLVEITAEAPLSKERPDWRAMRGMFRDGADLVADLTADRAAEIARDKAERQGR